MDLEPVAQGPGADRDHHVVDGRAGRPLDVDDPVEGQPGHGEAPVRRHRPVPRHAGSAAGRRARRRRRRPTAPAGGGRSGRAPACAAPSRPAVSPSSASWPPRPLRVRLATRPGKPAARRSWSIEPSNSCPTACGGSIGGCGCTCRTLAVRIEQGGHHLDAGDVVDRRHVGLGVERHRAVGEAIDEPQLPQGPGPVEGEGVEAGDEGGQRRRPPRRRDRGVAQVELEVEPGARSPRRTGEAERRLHHDPPRRRDHWEALGQEVADDLVGQRTGLARREQRHAPDVTQLGRALHRQERGVHRPHPRHRDATASRGRRQGPGPATARSHAGARNGSWVPGGWASRSAMT